MRKPLLWLSLSLGSLMFSVSLVAATPVNSFASPNPAIAQMNPCASRNPCASKKENVGGPLADRLQGKPVVVDIYASWCPDGQNIAPTLEQLRTQYGDDIHFIVLDVSDRAKTSQSETLATELGLSDFFAAHRSQTGMVAIVDPATGNILAQHRNNANLADYTSVIDSAIAQR
ncbi:thioredoxin family protein [Phormidium pseudopriestleyi FRX01]|uniref:Thioredoxin family protein n=1 Tax=Phormidium pseudopriestleyi FRX01 TaxID=1759528 RepID=A0ABS3FR02_9CYAN|nr:thioredoxin family protein [Phormidium pseudopriestleyi]MBO0349551.1 thioredoxin family protein [Phormidium pseudopriestleyi FRX01]